MKKKDRLLQVALRQLIHPIRDTAFVVGTALVLLTTAYTVSAEAVSIATLDDSAAVEFVQECTSVDAQPDRTRVSG